MAVTLKEVFVAYNYGIPSEQASYPRPRCWADDRIYNETSHVCRSCPVEPSCRDQIVRMRNGSRNGTSSYPYATAPGYGSIPGFSPIPGPAPAPAPVQVRPYQQPLAPQQQQAAPQQQAMVGPYPAPPNYQYGWLIDPLYYTMAASPPPMIPTLDGERPLERVGKNMMIEFVRAFFGQGYLASRQLVLPPVRPGVDKDEGEE